MATLSTESKQANAELQRRLLVLNFLKRWRIGPPNLDVAAQT
jgi:hypothetical protein